MSELFIELLRVSLGLQRELSVVPSKDQWQELYKTSYKQALLGVAFCGIENLPETQAPPSEVFLKWYSHIVRIEQSNRLLNLRVSELSKICSNNSIKPCLLKGQGVARFYPNPIRRQAGDIDVWIEGSINNTLKAFKKIAPLDDVCYHHAHCHLFADTIVEVHFHPSWMYSPITNRRLRSFFKQNADFQFTNFNEELGINITNISFDLVFSAVHIYRHLFTEGIGLRQLLDYYYILIHSTKEQRIEAYGVLSSLNMTAFISALMYVLQKTFLLSEDFVMVQSCETVGNFLLEEITLSGNFGHHDSRIRWRKKNSFVVFLKRCARNVRFIRYFPSEVLWSPLWKIWHFFWRKFKIYDV